MTLFDMIIIESMPKIIIKQNIRKDAWNWWHACNKISYGENWSQRINNKLQNQLVNKTKKQAFNFLIPYLKKLYKKEDFVQKKWELQNILNKHQKEIFARMKKVTGRKIYKKNLLVF